MRAVWAVLVVGGCGALAEGLVVGEDPRAIRCDVGEPEVVEPASELDARTAEGTVVRRCLGAEGEPHGRHVEVYPSGGVAVIGAWADGSRAGTWNRWTESGAFAGARTWEAGTLESERLVSSDGRVIELRYEAGVAVDWRTLPRDTPMPEWSKAALGTGLRHLESNPGSIADP